MRHSIRGIRWIAGLALLLAFSALAVPAPSAGAQTGATLTVHLRICPADFTGPDYYGTCHGTAPDTSYDFTVTGPETATAGTDASGNVTFSGLAAGTYDVQGGPPGDVTRLNAYCADADDLSTAVPFTDNGSYISLALANGDNVVCDWYITPESQGPPASGDRASISIYKTTCPVGYEGEDYFEDCYGNPTDDVTFSLIADGAETGLSSTTGSEGYAAFEDLGGGTYTLSEDIPGEFNDFVAFCSAGGVAFPFDYATDANGIVLDLTTADDIRCDFYNIPEDLRGETPVPTAAPTAVPTKTTTTTVTAAKLPNTGAGASSGDATATLALAGLLAAVGIGLAGFTWRSRTAHRTR